MARKEALFIVGTGLTMIDATLTLLDEGYEGRIVALSRGGRLPAAHRRNVPPSTFALDLTDTATAEAIDRQLREHLARHPEEDWRSAVDSLRPHTQRLWLQWSVEERRRFLRDFRSRWDVRRHRIAPAVAQRLEQLRESGRLEVLAGRVGEARAVAGEGVRVELTLSGEDGAAEERQFSGVINGTGPQSDVAHNRQPLFRSLLAQGLLTAAPLGLGPEVDGDGALIDSDGRAAPDLFAVGPLCKAKFWEITAVPDIRQQTALLSERLLRDLGEDAATLAAAG